MEIEGYDKIYAEHIRQYDEAIGQLMSIIKGEVKIKQ